MSNRVLSAASTNRVARRLCRLGVHAVAPIVLLASCAIEKDDWMFHFTREYIETGSSDTTKNYRTVGSREDLWVLPMLLIWPLVLDIALLPAYAVHDLAARQ